MRQIDWLSTLLEKKRAPLGRRHLRWREPRLPALRRCFFLLDCSASMVGSGALAQAKGWLTGVSPSLRHAGAHVALVSFGGGRAEVHFGPGPLPDHRGRNREIAPERAPGPGRKDAPGNGPSNGPSNGPGNGPGRASGRASGHGPDDGRQEWDNGWNAHWLEPIGGGGGTPLALGLATLVRLRDARRPSGRRNACMHDILVVLSDGRTAERPPAPKGFARIVLVDFETRRIALNGCAALAAQWGAECMSSGKSLW